MNRERIVVLALLGGLLAFTLSRGTVDRSTVLLIAVIIPSIILHEVAHGAVANVFGDDTAKRAGRLTLNPLPHIDPLGTIVLPAILAISGAPPFGFAKPVPVNVSRLRDPRNNGLLVSLAGPATNFTIAFIAAMVWRQIHPVFDTQLFDNVELTTAQELTLYFGLVNVGLGVFNLLPIPPLDGSALVERLLPERLWPKYLELRRYSMILVLIVVFWLPGVLDAVMNPAYDLWERIAGTL